MKVTASASMIVTAAVLLTTMGCAGVWPAANEQEQQASQPVHNKLLAAQKLVQGAKFADAVSAYRLILKEHPGTEWAPEAKYGIALVYASADNPQRDYAAAVSEFDDFLSLYPTDKRAAEAKSWRKALKLLLDTKKDNDLLHKNIEKLKQLDVRQEEKRLGR